MISPKQDPKILIVGGGVAGASLAIRLASQGLDVIVVEKDKFPRHKLCGEFVSPECLKHFDELGVLENILESGGDAIRETRFFSESGKSVSVPSEWFSGGAGGALGISRAEMDFQMMEKAREAGATVFEESRVTGVDVTEIRIDSVTVKNSSGDRKKLHADLIVDATGRARVLGKLIERQTNSAPTKTKLKHVAFKAHFENAKLEQGVCEIYFFRGGYGGLNYVENGAANHCFIVSSKVAREFNGDAERILSEVIFKNKRAFDALKNADKKFDWLAVSIEKFGRQPSNDIENLNSVGDASAFIDPFTGSGMLMALESSRILAKLILRNRAESSFASALIKDDFEDQSRVAIKRRLGACSVIHRLSFSPMLANFVISIASLNPNWLQKFAALTRPIQKPKTIR